MPNCGFALPCTQPVSTVPHSNPPSAALEIDNTGTYGSAIKGKNTVSLDPAIWGDSESNEGVGVQGTAQGQGTGVQGIVHGGLGRGIYGYSDDGTGVAGQSATGAGVSGLSTGSNNQIANGVFGESSNGNGVFGSSTGYNGVMGWSIGYNGVMGHSEEGSFAGVYGENVAGGDGVLGRSDTGPGVHGVSNSGKAAVLGECYGPATSDGSTCNGVTGISSVANGVTGTSYTNFASGVIGVNDNTDTTQNSRYGVVGITTGTTGYCVGVMGQNLNGGYAGSFNGPVYVSGFLTKAGGGFKIDHPLDPGTKYLNHSFVESSEMKNVYDGIATLDSDGSVWVELPSWFEALNRDFRYQLTPIGSSAAVYVAQEIASNRFQIAGGKSGQRISWLVTGIRRDAWAEKNPMAVEENKDEADQGKFLHPLEAGHSREMGIPYSRTRALEVMIGQQQKIEQDRQSRSAGNP
jgi:hypothetical protein